MLMREKGVSRRSALAGATASAFAMLLSPRLVMADASKVADELKKLFGDKKIADGKIKLDVPQIAENGLVVPISIDVDSPMTETDHVTAIHVFADGNPLPGVATFRFTPACGKASASTRIRLSQTQNIVCVAEMSNGALHTAKAEVKVTIGGCGG